MRIGILWGLSLAVFHSLNLQAGSPRIEFEKTVYDFGRLSQKESVTNSFRFKNTGDAELELGGLATSCGCLEAQALPLKLAPGATGDVVFSLHMPSVRALVDRQIEVLSNDSQNPKVTLSVKADYVPLFEIKPILLQVEGKAGLTTNLSALVRRTDGKPLEFLKIEPSKPWINATILALDPGGTEARFQIEAKLEGPPRHFAEYVRFFVDDPNEPAVTAVLMGRVLGNLQLSPEKLQWSIDPSAGKTGEKDLEANTQRLTIRSTLAGHRLELRNVASTLDELKPELRDGSGSQTNSYELITRLIKRPQTTARGMISFETNLPNQPKAEVPVAIIVSEPAK